MPIIVGESVGPYRLVEQLGQGGMATVFKAYHSTLDRYVAIKALHPAFSQDPNFLTRFQREAQVVARLEHPNIVPIYDYAEHEGRPYLVMKFIEGETLKARLKRSPIDLEEINLVVESVGAALSYAHEKGILHRDVKPSNVLIAKDGRIYLADFGLARMAEAGESTISSDMMLGTPQYISPEQAQGRRDLDAGTDIYSFGILIYELMVGKVPYAADTPYSIIHDHIFSPLPVPRSIKPEISPSVERVILKALAKDRSDRFTDIPSLVAAWEKANQEDGQAHGGETVELSADSTVMSEKVTIVQPPLISPPEQREDVVSPAQSIDQSIKTPAKRKSNRIWLVAAGMVALVCLLITAVAILSSIEKRQELNAQIPPAAPPVLSSPVSEPFMNPAVQPPPVAEALERARQEPENPESYFGLAIAFLDVGQPENAEQAFIRAAELAGQLPEFYNRAGDEMRARQIWDISASFYLEALKRMPDPVPEEWWDNLYQTLYLSADMPRIKDLLHKAPLERLHPGFVELVNERTALYQGETASVAKAIDRFSRQYPDTPGIRLLESELIYKKGDVEKAKQILSLLIGSPKSSEWVKRVADYLLTKTKN